MKDLPRWAARLLVALAPTGEADDVLGDLEEAHRRHLERHRPAIAGLRTIAGTLDMAAALIRTRFARLPIKGSIILQDYRLGLRMLAKYPGLTLAGGLALALAIGIGAGWYELTRTLWRPTLPFPDGQRIVEIEMRNAAASQEERRLLHDFLTWRRDARSVTDLGAYRTVERNVVAGGAGLPESLTVAEITPSAFQLPRIPPLLGRPLIDADEQPGAADVAVLGYHLWRTHFGGRSNVIGETLLLGGVAATIVGVMPDGFAFPINHKLWTPLRLPPSGYGPLQGPSVRIVARLAPDSTQAGANVEFETLVRRAAAESPRTYERLAPRVLAYGGESPGDRSLIEFLVTHGPVLLVLLVACVNVGTLIYARTATRQSEIATRHALGAGRWRIVSQLFVEALVLAAAAAMMGLIVADWALKWGVTTYYAGQSDGAPFWIDPGLRPRTILYAFGLTVAGAAMLGVLPALRLTRLSGPGMLHYSAARGSTVTFGPLWTAIMIGQVALTVICLPPAAGIANEAIRDRMIRSRFPAEQYLAVEVEFERPSPVESGATARADANVDQEYRRLERLVSGEPGVVAVTFADRLPGMGPAVQSAEVEAAPQSAATLIPNLWTAVVGPGYFDAFQVPILSGRDFHDGDRRDGARTAIVNEAFARRYLDGANPVGARVRYVAVDPTTPEPWFEIVGMVRDTGMTPTDDGEAPYMFRAATPAGTSPLVMGIRVAGDPRSVAPRVRALASGLNAGLRIETRTLDDHAWRVDLPMMVAAGGIAGVVGLGLFLSAAGIFALMSVSVARRTREIGLRTALGAPRNRLVASVLSHAALVVGVGVAAGNTVLLLFVAMLDEVDAVTVAPALASTSAVMIGVGIAACVEPARRALRIEPSEALKET